MDVKPNTTVMARGRRVRVLEVHRNPRGGAEFTWVMVRDSDNRTWWITADEIKPYKWTLHPDGHFTAPEEET